jgi:hypothetical protein
MKLKGLIILAVLGALFTFQHCNETNELSRPVVTTAEATHILITTITTGGEVVADGNAAVTVRGVCWSTSPEPTVEGNTTSDGAGRGVFSSSLTGLTGGTTYYVRAYATNKVGTSYGEEIEFTTLPAPTAPTVTTTVISGITANAASSGGNVITDGGSEVTARGLCWSTNTAPTTADNKTTDGAGTGNYTSALTNLMAATTYYVRAYATNTVGTTYGNEISFSTLSLTATLYTVKDASIFNNEAGTANNGNYGTGGSELLQVGYGGGVYARSLVEFDLSSIPSNAVIESVHLEFTTGSSGSNIPIIYVHKLTQGWTEGTNKEVGNCSFNTTCNIQGVAIPDGGTDVTWNETSYSGTTMNPGANLNPWTTPGGHFNSTSSAASNEVGATSLTYSSALLKNDVEGWLLNPSTNFGWILKSDFNINLSSAMKRFRSREGATASGDVTTAPRLVIIYH